jgi:hypothetical protein
MREIHGRHLRANHSHNLPRRIVVFDTETEGIRTPHGELQVMKLAWSVYAELDGQGRPIYESWNHWDSRWKLMRYLNGLAHDERELWIAGNNIYFDLQASDFFLHFTRWGWRLDFVYDSALTYILVAREGKHEIKVVSVTNYYGASVKDLGKMIGREKIECDPLTAPVDLLMIYCHRDTEITLDSLLLWIRHVAEDDLGNFGLSRASQAMNAFRHRFMSVKILVHREEDVQELESQAYFGGRCEAYHIGLLEEGPFVHLDVNSLYPFVMRSYQLPTALVDTRGECSPGDMVDILLEHEVIAEVELSTDAPLYPYRQGWKVMFPIGQFRTTLCTESLRQALLRGHLKRIHRVAVYKCARIFTEYVDHFYHARLEAKARGDRVGDVNAKRLMNCLYGKFAQRRPVLEISEDDHSGGYYRKVAIDEETHQTIVETCMLGRHMLYSGECYTGSSVVSIPAHVTDFARCLLWEIIEGIGVDRVIYCDTDSVVIRERDLPLVKHPLSADTLGALKVEARYQWIEIYGAKDYQTDTVRKLKGVPAKAEKLPGGAYRFPVFLRQASHLEQRIVSGYKIVNMVKQPRSAYDKGSVNADGSVSPWILPEDQWLLSLSFEPPAPEEGPEVAAQSVW